MGNKNFPLISIKTSTFYILLVSVVIGLTTLAFVDINSTLIPDRRLAIVGILSSGLMILAGLCIYVTGLVVKVKPQTAYISPRPNQRTPIQSDEIIFDNHTKDADYFCWPLSGKKIHYHSISDISLSIQAMDGVVKYEVRWDGRLDDLLAIQRIAISRDRKLRRWQPPLRHSPVLWFRRWTNHKNRKLQEYINGIEARTNQPMKRGEIIQKVSLLYLPHYANFGLEVNIN